MDRQAVPADLAERQIMQAIQRIIRGDVGQHACEQRHGHATNHARRLERPPRDGVRDVVEVERAELVDDARRSRIGHGNIRVLACSGRCQAQRKWVALRQALDRRSGAVLDAFAPKQLQRIGSFQAPQVQDLDGARQLGRSQPAGDRRLSAGEHDAGRIGKRRHEDLAQPRVDQPKDLVVIDDDDRSGRDLAQSGVQPFGCRALAAQRRGERVVDPAVRRFEGPAIELDDGRPGVPRVVRETGNEGRLADAGNAVNVDDERLVAGDGFEECTQFLRPANEADGAPIAHAVADTGRQATSDQPPQRPGSGRFPGTAGGSVNPRNG